MRWRMSERKAARVLKLARWPLLRVLAQVLLDATLRSDQAHQRFRLMGVELIGDKNPGGVRIGLESLGDVSGKVGKGRAWVQCWER